MAVGVKPTLKSLTMGDGRGEENGNIVSRGEDGAKVEVDWVAMTVSLVVQMGRL